MASRPERWKSAVSRANDALHELNEMCGQLIAAREQLEEKWTQHRARLNRALLDLIQLQDEYASKTVPDNLSESRTQERLYRVADFDFEKLRDKVPAMEAVFEVLDGFNPMENDDFGELYEAGHVELPKFYGRD